MSLFWYSFEIEWNVQVWKSTSTVENDDDDDVEGGDSPSQNTEGSATQVDADE